MPANVFFHHDFYNGNWRCDKFSDFPRLTTLEAIHLADFVFSVVDGDDLIGRNKPSWKKTKDVNFNDREGYKSSGLWHYHAGPYSQKILQGKNVRNEHFDGAVSSAVIHYKWIDPSEKANLLIISFSPSHVPFPAPRDKVNKLSKRGGMSLTQDRVHYADIYD